MSVTQRLIEMAGLIETAAGKDTIPMRTLVTKAGGTSALRKMSYSKAAQALRNAAKELQAERKAKGQGYKLDKTAVVEWLDTNTPKRSAGAKGAGTRPKSKVNPDLKNKVREYKNAGGKGKAAPFPKETVNDLNTTQTRNQLKKSAQALDLHPSVVKDAQDVMNKYKGANLRDKKVYRSMVDEMADSAADKRGYDRKGNYYVNRKHANDKVHVDNLVSVYDELLDDFRTELEANKKK